MLPLFYHLNYIFILQIITRKVYKLTVHPYICYIIQLQSAPHLARLVHLQDRRLDPAFWCWAGMATSRMTSLA